MRKEIIYAIVAGALFGLVIAFGIWKANAPKPENAQSDQEETQGSPTPEGNVSNTFGITLAKPQNYQVISSTSTILSGATSPGNWVIIGANENYFTKTDNNGIFEKEIKLISGINNITIYSVSQNGSVSKIQLTLVSSLNFITTKQDSRTSDDATQSADSIRDAVEKKLAETKSNPTSYIGTVTDISEATIQIKKYSFDSTSQSSNEIQQIATSTDTTYAKIGDNPKTLKSTDIAIGDFIAALGYKNGKDVLNASRILVTSQPNVTSDEVLLVKSTKITKSDIQGANVANDDEVTINVGKNTDILTSENEDIALADIEDESNLIVLGIKNKEEYNASAIYVIVSEIEESPVSTPKLSPTPKATTIPKASSTPKPTP